MDKAAEEMTKINSTSFNKPQTNIVHNVTASTEKHEKIKKLLIKQISSQVRWRESMNIWKKTV